ncbi:MAG TPA: lysine-sensitive aspartokinase 3 [Planctomycetota bacterium]|nr:lysine-sensitive aspartokinase 3 [Planctomycetota bacterium]
MRVLKFGGSSVADAVCLRRVAERATAAAPAGAVVVLSAMGKTTDALFRAGRAAREGDAERALAEAAGLIERHRATARELFGEALPAELEAELETQFGELEAVLRGVSLLRELSTRSMDALASHGERLSTRLFAALLASQGLPTALVDARTVVRTDERFGEAQPQRDAIRRLAAEHIAPQLAAGRVVVTQGYIGSTADGRTTTLGRGGSDWTAALLGAALGAQEVQIWTDVEGVYTADPRVVPGAGPIEELSFAEAAELAAFGAKVLHPETIQPAVEAHIPVTVRHTERPDGRFTTIREHVIEGRPVTALATRGPIAIVTVTSSRMLAQSGFLARLFEVFARLDVSVDLVATAEVSVSLSVEADAPLDRLREELERFARVEVATDRALVALVGERLKQTSGIAARAFRALEDVNVELISMGANEINLSVVVAKASADEAVRRLHGAFFER